jgi:hypothetical protein
LIKKNQELPVVYSDVYLRRIFYIILGVGVTVIGNLTTLIPHLACNIMMLSLVFAIFFTLRHLPYFSILSLVHVVGCWYIQWFDMSPYWSYIYALNVLVMFIVLIENVKRKGRAFLASITIIVGLAGFILYYAAENKFEVDAVNAAKRIDWVYRETGFYPRQIDGWKDETRPPNYILLKKEVSHYGYKTRMAYIIRDKDKSRFLLTERYGYTRGTSIGFYDGENFDYKNDVAVSHFGDWMFFRKDRSYPLRGGGNQNPSL